mmetsp:Transcript_14518/g.20303  ORF Transcript_14518/g.20303 Transcript_14518/m.20303 type:complete len:162 (-) Transcript_14518:380-865(-)
MKPSKKTLTAEVRPVPAAYLIGKLSQAEITENKNPKLPGVDGFKIIRVMIPQGMYQFAVPEKTYVQDLEELMRDRLKDEAKASASKDVRNDESDSSSSIDDNDDFDPCRGKAFKFFYRGQQLQDTVDSVEPGETITLCILNAKKAKRSVCRTLFQCSWGRF